MIMMSPSSPMPILLCLLDERIRVLLASKFYLPPSAVSASAVDADPAVQMTAASYLRLCPGTQRGDLRRIALDDPVHRQLRGVPDPEPGLAGVPEDWYAGRRRTPE